MRVRLETTKQGVLRIGLGAGSLRCELDHALVWELDRALSELSSSPSLHAAVLFGAASSGTLAGPPHDAVFALSSHAEARAFLEPAERLAARLGASKKPIVAALQGEVTGSGLELVLAARERVTCHDLRASFEPPELGLLPGALGLLSLARLLGAERAFELFVAQREIDAKTLHRWGLSHTVTGAESLLAAAERRALELCNVPPRSAAAAVSARGLAALRKKLPARATSDARVEHAALDVLETLARSGEAHAARQSRALAAELLVSTTTHQALRSAARLRQARADARALRQESAAWRLRIQSQSREALTLAASLGGRAQIELGSRTLVDDPHLQHDTHVLCDQRAVRLIGAATGSIAARDSAAVGFFVPPTPRDLGMIEITRSTATDPPKLALASELAASMGTVPLVFGDGVMRLTARFVAVYVDEAERLLREGASASLVREALAAWGFLKSPSDLARDLGPTEVDRWRDELPGPRDTWVTVRARPPSAEEVQARCSLRIVVEALRAEREGVVLQPDDADLAAQLSLGFPHFRGGPMAYAKHLGVELHERLRALARRGERFAL